ncbi:MAG: hypothetical protein LAT54_08130 [Cryomorphaceae bacterium]|nr:hypothetical protein [Cryomorphaceae bacterium]
MTDEAQRIENTGIKLKRISDQMKDVQLVVIGSSFGEHMISKRLLYVSCESKKSLSSHWLRTNKKIVYENPILFSVFPDGLCFFVVYILQ